MPGPSHDPWECGYECSIHMGTNPHPDQDTLHKWMLDMTGPEDAWAREQYAEIITLCKEFCERGIGPISRVVLLNKLREALKRAGEL